jgi:hypothetical protein
MPCSVYCVFIVPTGTLRLPWLRFFPCFFLSCKANARVYLAKTEHGPQSSYFQLCCSMYSVVLFYYSIVLFHVLFLIVLLYLLFFVDCVFLCILFCKRTCIPYYCHRVSTQLQLNISYPISYIIWIFYWKSHSMLCFTSLDEMGN